MTKIRFATGIILSSLLLLSLGCASAPSNFKFSEVPRDDVTFMGHVDVLVDNVDQTEHCYIEFTDENGSRKAYVSLDKTGWVFAHAKPGPLYLSSALCQLGTVFRHLGEFKSRDIKYLLPNAQQVSYFGHITLKIADSNPLPGLVLFGLAGAATQAAIASNHPEAPKPFLIENKIADAQLEFQRRFDVEAGKTQLAELAPIPITVAPASEKPTQ